MTYWSLNNLYSDNIQPVIINILETDGQTKPPNANLKKKSGRPPKQRRYRVGSKFDNPEKDSPIVCKKCQIKGHNSKSCEAYHARLAMLNKKKTTNKASIGTQSDANQQSEANQQSFDPVAALERDPGYMRNIN